MSFEFAVILFLFTFNVIVLSFYFKLLIKLKTINKKEIDTTLEELVLKEVTVSNSSDDNQYVHQENFIKFLSDSRDWAFDYIDKSQKQIKEFVDIADKKFAFFDKYGVLSEGDIHYETMKSISEEYKKLKLLLPEESDDRR